MKEPKLKTVYVCSNCGETSPRWMGRCPSCGSWNTHIQFSVLVPSSKKLLLHCLGFIILYCSI